MAYNIWTDWLYWVLWIAIAIVVIVLYRRRKGFKKDIKGYIINGLVFLALITFL